MSLRWYFGSIIWKRLCGDDLILNPLFKFESMKGLEHWRDVRIFGSTGKGTCKSILNVLKTLNLSDG